MKNGSWKLDQYGPQTLPHDRLAKKVNMPISFTHETKLLSFDIKKYIFLYYLHIGYCDFFDCFCFTIIFCCQLMIWNGIFKSLTVENRPLTLTFPHLRCVRFPVLLHSMNKFDCGLFFGTGSFALLMTFFFSKRVMSFLKNCLL